jgi:hypothetical protein
MLIAGRVRARHRGLLDERGNAPLIVLAVLVVALFAGALTLHFTLKRHDILPFDVDAAYPPEKTLVGGEAFAATAAAIMDHELSSGTGWRPNDFLLWGPTLGPDNKASRQLGIIQALRESVRVFKDHLTKISSNEYDPNLVQADRLFRNDETKFWLPSAESRFEEGVETLRRYLAGLEQTPPTSRPLNRRNIEAIRLFQTWSDLLGDAHGELYKEREPDGSSIRMWKSDDYFYHAQGMAHAIHHLTKAVRREYAIDLPARPSVAALLDEVIDALGRAAVMKPFVVLDGGTEGLTANHRRNLDVYIVEARQKMYSIREELEK